MLAADTQASYTFFCAEEGSGAPQPPFHRKNGLEILLLLTLGAHAQRGLQYLGLSVCVSVKSHLTYGASVCPENAVMYLAGNEGQTICGVFPENAPLLRLSGVAVVFHTFRWPFFFTASGAHAYQYSQLCL